MGLPGSSTPSIVRVTDGAMQSNGPIRTDLYTIIEVISLQEAARLLDHFPTDLLVSDVRCEDEFQQVQALRRRFPSMSVVLISRKADTPPDAAFLDACEALYGHGKINDGLLSGWRPNRKRPGQIAPKQETDGHSRVAEIIGPALSPEIGRAIAFLHVHFRGTEVSLDKAATQACMSRFHFSRTFRRETGMRYIDYLTGLRLDLGRRLLVETGLSVTTICFEIGYNDLTHFERMFKKQFGLTPSEYRRRERQAADQVRRQSEFSVPVTTTSA